MGFKGFALSYIAVDPLDDFDENSEIFEEESAEIATPFPGYLTGGRLVSFSKKPAGEDDDNIDGEEEITDPKNEDLVPDNDYIFNSNRIGAENTENSMKRKEEIDSY